MMEGDVSAIDLLARLVELGREHFTGAIRFESEGIIKIIYFKGGDVLSASTNDRSDSVDEILLRAGKVTREHVKQALAKRKETETLGDALLNLGFITRKELTWGAARSGHRRHPLRSLRGTPERTRSSPTIFRSAKREPFSRCSRSSSRLIVTEQDRSKFERALDGGSAVFKKAGEFDSHYRDLGLNEDADAVAQQIDGERAASEVASFAGRDAFNVFKLLHAFNVLGLIERTDKPQPSLQFTSAHTGDDLLSSAGVADADDMWNPTAPGNVPVPPPIRSAPPGGAGAGPLGVRRRADSRDSGDVASAGSAAAIAGAIREIPNPKRRQTQAQTRPGRASGADVAGDEEESDRQPGARRNHRATAAPGRGSVRRMDVVAEAGSDAADRSAIKAGCGEDERSDRDIPAAACVRNDNEHGAGNVDDSRSRRLPAP